MKEKSKKGKERKVMGEKVEQEKKDGKGKKLMERKNEVHWKGERKEVDGKGQER